MSAAREQNFLKEPCAASLFHLWAGLRVRGERKQRQGKILHGWFARWQSALLIEVFAPLFAVKSGKKIVGGGILKYNFIIKSKLNVSKNTFFKHN